MPAVAAYGNIEFNQFAGSDEYFEKLGYGNKYRNIFYIWDRGQALKFEREFSHFEMSWLILSLLSGNECKNGQCVPVDLQARYQQVMAHAMKLSGPELGSLFSQ